MYTIAFDADDTLWDNEIFFRESEKKFCMLLSNFASENEIMELFFRKEVENISVYGYGVKNFIISAIESAGIISNGSIPYQVIKQIIQIGREQLNKPVNILPEVKSTLHSLKESNYPIQIIIATKGDLLDQERKIELSGLRQYFNNSFIMFDKQVSNYQHLLEQINCSPNNFIMIGNSLKSDALPVLELGCKAIYVPYKTTWQHEVIDPKCLELYNNSLFKVNSISEILPIINNIINNL